MSAETHLEVYRPFTGELRQSRLRFWAVTATGLRTALKQRKALLILYMPAFIGTVIACFIVYGAIKAEAAFQSPELRRQMDPAELLALGAMGGVARQAAGAVSVILHFSQILGVWTFLTVAWFASGLFCEDRKAGAHQLYFSRPITRFDYLLGKFLIGCAFAAATILIPPLVVCTMATFSVPEWGFLKNEWDTFPRALAFGAVWTATLSSLVLAASALASRKSFALLGVFAVVFLSLPLSQILGQLVHDGFFALNLMGDLFTVANDTFDRGGGFIEPRRAWTAIAVLNVASWAVMWWRLRRLEVVA